MRWRDVEKRRVKKMERKKESREWGETCAYGMEIRNISMKYEIDENR